MATGGAERRSRSPWYGAAQVRSPSSIAAAMLAASRSSARSASCARASASELPTSRSTGFGARESARPESCSVNRTRIDKQTKEAGGSTKETRMVYKETQGTRCQTNTAARTSTEGDDCSADRDASLRYHAHAHDQCLLGPADHAQRQHTRILWRGERHPSSTRATPRPRAAASSAKPTALSPCLLTSCVRPLRHW